MSADDLFDFLARTSALHFSVTRPIEDLPGLFRAVALDVERIPPEAIMDVLISLNLESDPFEWTLTVYVDPKALTAQ